MHFLKIALQCTCLTDTSCFSTYKNGIILFKVQKKKKKKNTEDIDPKNFNTSNGRAMVSSKCVICGIKKSKFTPRNKTTINQIRY